MTILYIYPSNEIIDILKETKKDFLCCDSNGKFSFFKNGVLNRSFDINENIHYLDINQTEQILKDLDYFSPVFARWIHKGHHYENLKDKYVFKISQIIAIIKKFRVKKAFFFTAISHHLDNYCFELAFKKLNLEQIFLYPLFPKFELRLIPFVQKQGINSRSRLGQKISDFKFDKLLNYLVETQNVNNPKTFKLKIFNFIKTNLYLSLAYLGVRKVKRIITNTPYLLKLKNKSEKTDDYFSETFISDFELALSQEKYLYSYKKESLNFKEPVGDKVYLLLAAHFQPEATSFPESGRVYSHLHLISHLRNIGLKGQIFYKEHFASLFFIEGGHSERFVTGPTRVGINRNFSYLKELKKLGCSFLPIDSDLNTFKNFLPITLCGSIAIERSLNGLHTIYAGNAWWEGLPGTIKLSDNPYDLNNLPRSLITPSKDIAFRAKEFILEILNYKTLSNQINIGILEKNKINQTFKKEFNNLIELIN